MTFDSWSRELLEYEDVRALIGRYVGSALGQAELAAVAPSADRAAVEARLAELTQAMAYLEQSRQAKSDGAVRLRFSDLPDVAEPSARLRIEGTVLDGKELAGLGAVLLRASEARSALGANAAKYPLLAARAAGIPDLRPVLREIEGKILHDGSVADDASVALARLRRDRLKQQSAIQESLERFVKAHRDDGLLQEDYVTVRNDRFVVPVVAGQKRKVDGVIHGASGTGQTLFLEPMETIHLNNELVRIGEEEMREVHRILRELTATLRAAGPAVPEAVRILAKLDLLFGTADYALDYDCSVPRFSGDDRMLEIRGARHPLLAALFRREKKAVVPVSVELDRETRTLLITGPNTGGKTVSMKTIGLFALMAQSGWPLPAGAATLPVFEEVLADIGDNQSIAESLSSFSAHVKRLKEILDSATRESLVLLDELGRATDPEEGGALGVATVDALRNSGTFTIASTHLLALKVYGATTPGVLNASMGFDEQTLTPTYVLRLGAPGKSAGLDIASRLGLPASLIERARSAMSTNERDIARFLSELHAKIETASAIETELKTKLERVAGLEKELNEALAKKESSKVRELEVKFSQLMDAFESASRETIEDIRSAAAGKKAADQAQAKASKHAREFREQSRSLLRPEAGGGVLRIVEGARVKLNGIREIARVRRMLANGVIEVEAGFMKLQVPESDVVEVLPESDGGAKLPKNVSFEAGPSWTVSQREINVIGKTSDEARDEVEKFLDNASLASVDRVRIVHGHGMGVLKRMVAELLSRHPHVEKSYPAPPGEGGTGATIAELSA